MLPNDPPTSLQLALQGLRTLDLQRGSHGAYQRSHHGGWCSLTLFCEGAAYEEGRGPSFWDFFTHKYPDKIADCSNGDVAIESNHRYKEDVGMMKKMELDAYRFSISWSRMLPKGKLRGGINKERGLHYNDLINELLAYGIQPFVILFHWDLPQALEEEYDGFLSAHVMDDFRDYVEVCFKEFENRVKNWITLNKPVTYGRNGGDSDIESYIVKHNQFLAHAVAVKLYKDKYQASQNGVIGITLVSHWIVPYSDAKPNQNAAPRALDWMFLDPITYCDYPHSMRSFVGKRLPKFTKEQLLLVKGSFDFLLHCKLRKGHLYSNALNSSYLTDATERHSIPIGHWARLILSATPFCYILYFIFLAASTWQSVYPSGIQSLLMYVKTKYQNPLIYITKNVIDEFNNSTLPLKQQLAYYMRRIDYYYRQFLYLHKGYFAWSLLDNFEWSLGDTIRFGINYVDYKNRLKRYPKQSTIWFKSFLNKF
ncbi:hypothetical protein ACJRO7_012848 [Eucalyptus globulus]|uniref:Uncharacterized protein n=1 Tax=Eucalyptus globulus TaxID=34317 RepID=A0ABD3LQL3_EUCGL